MEKLLSVYRALEAQQAKSTADVESDANDGMEEDEYDFDDPFMCCGCLSFYLTRTHHIVFQ